MSLVFAILAYLGWWGTEVIYNQYIIHAMYSVAANAAGAVTATPFLC